MPDESEFIIEHGLFNDARMSSPHCAEAYICYCFNYFADGIGSSLDVQLNTDDSVCCVSRLFGGPLLIGPTHALIFIIKMFQDRSNQQYDVVQ
jgi:hypothetical protein